MGPPTLDTALVYPTCGYPLLLEVFECSISIIGVVTFEYVSRLSSCIRMPESEAGGLLNDIIGY
jgi:hypothetical protein